MKVSVLVPVFNGEVYLAECLESVLGQDFSDSEILIGDDTSTDRSVEIIKYFASRDSRIRWWRNPHNLGLTANSNACLKAAKGEFIKFIHQDDKFVCPSAIRKMVAALEAYPGASLVACRQHYTQTDAESKLEPLFFSDKTGRFEGRRMIITCLERDGNLIGSPTMTLFRRSQAQRGFDERFTFYMDLEMWLYLLEQGDYVCLEDELATWRLHAKQTTALMSGIPQPDNLLLVQTYYAKPWLRAAATRRMLFVQSRSLKKKYGSQAASLVQTMLASLGLWNFLALWAERKLRKIVRWADKTGNWSQYKSPPSQV